MPTTISIPIYRLSRELLNSSRTYYVRKDGNDANNGLANTNSEAFLTIQKAADTVASLDSGIFDVTIQIADGVYASVDLKPLTGAGKVLVRGNLTTPGNVVIKTTSSPDYAACITAANNYDLSGFRVESTSSNAIGLSILESGKVHYQNLEFGTGLFIHIAVSGTAICTGSYKILSGGWVHFYATKGAVISVETSGTTIALIGTPAFSLAFVYLFSLSQMYMESAYTYFSGQATGKRFLLKGLSYFVGSNNNFYFLPGNVDGTLSANSFYE